MEFSTGPANRTDELIALFTTTFAESEGAAEGDAIGRLVAGMLATVEAADIFVVSASEAGTIAGAIIFTRLRFPEDDRTVFLLSPVAVSTSRQGKGIGQKLLKFGLNGLREKGVDVVLTYGDINFYSRVGFAQLAPGIAQPPQPLKYPDGWLGQSLTDKPLDPLKGPSRCVAALDHPDYW